MKIDGKVVSYDENKKFGFIRDEKGQSYFFHISSLTKEFKAKTNNLKIGLSVSFEPAAEPKGMAAKKIEFVKMHEIQKLSDFKNFHNRKVNSGTVLESKSFRTRFYKSPHDAKLQLENMAKKSGANVIFDEKIHRETWAEGNYNYSMHQCSATVGIRAESISVKDGANLDKSQSPVNQAIESFKIDSTEVIEAEEKAIADQKSSPSFAVVYFIAFFVLIVIMAS